MFRYWRSSSRGLSPLQTIPEIRIFRSRPRLATEVCASRCGTTWIPECCKLVAFTKVFQLYVLMPRQTRPIRRVAFPSSYWAKDPEVHKICLRFAESLADFMRTKLSFDSFAEIWNQTRPKEIDLSFNEYFKDVR